MAHLQPYSYRVYALRYNIDKLDRLESRVHIGYLVGYESTNIFKIWVPALHRVINARDVTFDQTKRYQPGEDFSEVNEQLVRPLKLLQYDQFEDEAEAEHQIQLPKVSAERSIDAPQDTIIVDSGQGIKHGTSLQLPTPQQSLEPDLHWSLVQQGVLIPLPSVSADSSAYTDAPDSALQAEPTLVTQPLEQSTQASDEAEPSSSSANPPTATERSKASETGKTKVPTTGTDKGMDLDLIIKGEGSRRTRHQEYYTTRLDTLHYNSVYHVAFQTGTGYRKQRIHRSELPTPPANWSEMLLHPHRASFQSAANLEYNELFDRGTFVPVDKNEAEEFIIPTH